MASAQVLRKQEHLEAGKKKLEEFRRKKAAEKAKKAASASHLHVSKDVLHEKQPSETELVCLPDSNGVGTSDNLAEARLETSLVFEKNEIQESDIAYKSDFSSSSHTNSKLSFLTSDNDRNSSVLEYSYLIGDGYKGDAASVGLDKPEIANLKFWSKTNDVSSAQVSSGIGTDHSLAHRISSNQEIYHASGRSSDSGLDDYPSTCSNGPEKDLLLGNSGTSAVFTQNLLPETSIRALLQGKFGIRGHQDNGLTSLPNQDPVSYTTMTDNSAFGEKQKFSELSDMVEMKSGGFAGQIGRVNYSPPLTSDHRYTDYHSDAQSSSSRAPLSPPAAGRRSRPSFLDSINILKGPSSPPLFGAAKADSSASKVYPMDSLGSLVSQKSVYSFVASGEGAGIFNHVLENKHDFFSQKQNEDFAALEQHIEDLTEQKFSLQRALESSRALTESLASENSTLTESFNQQGSIVNQLKFDLEKLQEEIKAQLVELEAVKIEYANAQLECNAADERAKLLASEVIGLEEKALRLRSNELKLERQLENSQAEISSCRKKMSSLEEDRQDLQSTIDALQEEKKLLQAKFRKASASGKSVEVNNTSFDKKDASTSTKDVDVDTIAETPNSDNHGTALLGYDASTSQFQHENAQLSLKTLPLTIPSDQIRMIQNINTLIAELALEKDQLIQAFSAESSQRSKLSELNKELTRKLESQTQRLELLMAQTMANKNIQPNQPDPRAMHERISYADEGDEVVERVLGWIMKHFPGGPSRQQTSKHL